MLKLAGGGVAAAGRGTCVGRAGMDAACSRGVLTQRCAARSCGMLWWPAAGGRGGGGQAGGSAPGGCAEAASGGAAAPAGEQRALMHCCSQGSRWPVSSSRSRSGCDGSSSTARSRTRPYSCGRGETASEHTVSTAALNPQILQWCDSPVQGGAQPEPASSGQTAEPLTRHMWPSISSRLSASALARFSEPSALSRAAMACCLP